MKMVANAGIASKGSLLESKWSSHHPHDDVSTLTDRIASASVEGWDNIMRINGRGVMLCYKHAAEQMIKQGNGGRIIGT